MDACPVGAGGVVIGENEACVPTMWRLEWPQEVQKLVQTEHNMTGTITNSDLEMAGFLLAWIVLEMIVPGLKFKHVGMYCDNQPTVSWADRMASKSLFSKLQVACGR